MIFPKFLTGTFLNAYNKLKQTLADLQGELIERIKKLSVQMDNEPAIIGRDLAILEIKTIFAEKLKDENHSPKDNLEPELDILQERNSSSSGSEDDVCESLNFPFVRKKYRI